MFLALPAPQRVVLYPGQMSAAVIRGLIHAPGKREFTTRGTTGRSQLVVEKSWPYGGKFKTYPKLTNVAYITSYAVLSSDMVTLRHALLPDRVIRAPAGLRFERDDNGLKVVRVSDGMDYHPDARDWAAPDFARRVRAGLKENRRIRLAHKRRDAQEAKDLRNAQRLEKLFRRDLPTTRVTLADSRAAGNCVEGSLAFAERKLGLSREDVLSAGYLFSVPASRLLAAANGSTPLATAAARAAWRRETMISI